MIRITESDLEKAPELFSCPKDEGYQFRISGERGLAIEKKDTTTFSLVIEIENEGKKEVELVLSNGIDDGGKKYACKVIRAIDSPPSGFIHVTRTSGWKEFAIFLRTLQEASIYQLPKTYILKAMTCDEANAAGTPCWIKSAFDGGRLAMLFFPVNSEGSAELLEIVREISLDPPDEIADGSLFFSVQISSATYAGIELAD